MWVQEKSYEKDVNLLIFGKSQRPAILGSTAFSVLRESSAISQSTVCFDAEHTISTVLIQHAYWLELWQKTYHEIDNSVSETSLLQPLL